MIFRVCPLKATSDFLLQEKETTFYAFVVPEKIHTHSMEGHWKFLGGGGGGS